MQWALIRNPGIEFGHPTRPQFLGEMGLKTRFYLVFALFDAFSEWMVLQSFNKSLIMAEKSSKKEEMIPDTRKFDFGYLSSSSSNFFVQKIINSTKFKKNSIAFL